MPKAVRAALVNALQTGGDMVIDDAEAYVSHMELKGRYKQETW